MEPTEIEILNEPPPEGHEALTINLAIFERGQEWKYLQKNGYTRAYAWRTPEGARVLTVLLDE